MPLEAESHRPEVCWQVAMLVAGVALAYWIGLGFVQGLPSQLRDENTAANVKTAG
ncbi:hypothetical protein K458DRAFT_383046 [Lentithecium fluviatile CBS 122367]|uniref:Uncharacterized protein n=1 Tax=Lentithecium fluviatile CBS 122367 TaxID=1168545 RepID=A0A6G1JH95_9PLEO|nr:hypothetical protein K458DRAFT_383046 [Lentithecium fluviatile CBS 122367]